MVDKELSGLRLETSGPDLLSDAAKQIVDFAAGWKVWVFEGDMGAGKTTLIKAICEELGVLDMVNSPTYSIVNEYENENGEVIFHFDFYRLKDEMEAMDIGTEEYLDSGNYCFVEWASRIEGLLPDKLLRIDISIVDEKKRLIEVTKYE